MSLFDYRLRLVLASRFLRIGDVRNNFSDVNHDFLVQTKEIIPGLLSPDNLVVKTIGGEPFTDRKSVV